MVMLNSHVVQSEKSDQVRGLYDRPSLAFTSKYTVHVLVINYIYDISCMIHIKNYRTYVCILIIEFTDVMYIYI